MVLNNENILNYVNQNRLLPLDDLLSQNGEGILEISEEYPIDGRNNGKG